MPFDTERRKIMKVLLLVIIPIIFIVGCSSNDGAQRKVQSVPSPPAQEKVYLHQQYAQNSVNEFRKYSEAPWGEDQFDNQGASPADKMVLVDYKVKKGDTLMLISQKLYGDYRHWKQIHALNPVSVKKLSVGKVIKVEKPKSPEQSMNKGLPYIITKGDTLGSISKQKYGTFKKWKNIYEHNKSIIKDPNRIYAGFTIYYVPVPTKNTVL